MGAAYDVSLTVKMVNETAAIKVLQEYIQDHNGKDCVFEDRQDRNTFDGLLKTFITDRDFYKEPQKDASVYYQSGFDASYGWESVMMDMFSVIAPYLAEGSSMKIRPDSDYDLLIVKDGRAVQVH